MFFLSCKSYNKDSPLALSLSLYKCQFRHFFTVFCRDFWPSPVILPIPSLHEIPNQSRHNILHIKIPTFIALPIPFVHNIAHSPHSQPSTSQSSTLVRVCQSLSVSTLVLVCVAVWHLDYFKASSVC